jgi:uncharacterized phage-associated protein/DNA-binding transcriptional regulator YiaG
MLSPFTGKEMSIQKEWRTMTYKKEEFRVCFHTWKCEDTGEQFEDDHFAQLNYDQVQNQYRAKYAIPFKEEIAGIRVKYELSAIKMSHVLGFGDNTYRQYEAGEMPTQANARLILMAANPVDFKNMVKISNLDDVMNEKLTKRIDHLLQEEIRNTDKRMLESYFLGMQRPSVYSGFRMPDLDKFAEMVFFFSEKLQPWKTKLNKLLFYADFLCFGMSGKSISGVNYRAIPMGPVPDKFQTLFEFLNNTQVVEISTSYFTNGGIGEQFFPAKERKFNSALFTEQEINSLVAVAERFKSVSTDDIIEISHKEKAWLDNKDKLELIDYLYAFDLN